MNNQSSFSSQCAGQCAGQQQSFLITLCGMLAMLLLPGEALAGQVFGVAIGQAEQVYEAGKTILDGLAVLGTVGVGVMAMSSRMPWGWAFAIIGGLMIVYLSDDIRQWIIDVGGQNAGDVQTVGQTLQDEMINNSAFGGDGSSIYEDVSQVANAYGGVALVAIAMVGFFGKFPFKWLFTVAGGLGIVLLADDIVLNTTDVNVGPTEGSREIFQQGEALADNTFLGARAFLYGIGAFAAIGLGIMAFMGQWRWTLAFGIVGGLVVIAAAQGGLEYLTGLADGGVDTIGRVPTIN